jgi:hypothetical protein
MDLAAQRGIVRGWIEGNYEIQRALRPTTRHKRAQGFIVFACKHTLSWRPAGNTLPKGATPLYAEDQHGTGIYLGGVSAGYPYDGRVMHLGQLIAQARKEMAKHA